MQNHFLQSIEWEKFQNSLHRPTFRIDDVLLVKISMTLGQAYLYSGRASFSDQESFDQFLSKAKELARKEKTFFLRIEPIFPHNNVDTSHLSLRPVNPRQPKTTLMIDLKKPEDLILSNMKQKTRYNIKLAEKKGVNVRISNDPKDIKIFFDIAKVTSLRDKIKIFPLEYYQKLAEVFCQNDMLRIYIAEYENRPIAANLMLGYKDTMTYLHGASSDNLRNLMSPYLLQWHAIKNAKNSGFSFYDFWGIEPLTVEDLKFDFLNNTHPWRGISQFKVGFAPTTQTGIYTEYPGCFEQSYGKKRYFMYSMFKKVL